MKLKQLLAVAVAAAFALPVAAQTSVSSDRMILAQGPAGASSMGTGPTGGTPSTQSAGEPKAPTADTAASKRCEGMVGTERETCLRDTRAPSGASAGSTGSSVGTTGSATGGATTSPSGSVVTPGGSGKTGTTVGPGEASPRTAPSSDTATSPSTSGTGKAQ
jgi:hypothetical protein